MSNISNIAMHCSEKFVRHLLNKSSTWQNTFRKHLTIVHKQDLLIYFFQSIVIIYSLVQSCILNVYRHSVNIKEMSRLGHLLTWAWIDLTLGVVTF